MIFVENFTSSKVVNMVLYDDYFQPLDTLVSNVKSVLEKKLIRNGTYYLICTSPEKSYPITFSFSYNLSPKYTLKSYSTKKVGNSGKSTIVFEGNGFGDKTKIKLAKTGCDTIMTDTLTLNRYKCSTLFNFNNKTLGKWDIVVNFGDTTVIFKQGLEIEAYKASEIIVDLVGQSYVRPNRYTTYTIHYINIGNTNAYEVPIAISATGVNIPKISTDWVYNLPQGFKTEDLPETSSITNPTTGKITTLVVPTIPMIPPSGEGYLSFGVNMNKPMEIVVTGGEPLFYADNNGKIVANENFYSCISGISDITKSKLTDWGVDIAKDLIPGLDCYKSAYDLGYETGKDLADNNGNFTKPVLGNLAWNLASTVTSCATDFVPATKAGKLAWNLVNTAVKIKDIYDDVNTVAPCSKALNGGKTNSIAAKIVTSIDPNDKIGYRSPSGSKYFNSDVTNFTYVINFENKATATAPAQEVFVTDTLDLNSFDINSFKAGYIKIGSKLVQAPVNVDNNTWTIDMRPSMNLIANVTLTLDKTKGIAKWYLKCVDPKTNDFPTDPLVGFLPPNDSIGSGEGSVAFTINLKSGVNDNAINNRAKIVFDTNEPIMTPTWSNKKDIVAPTSSMNQPIIASDSIATLNWQAEDNKGGSGVYSYNLYMKKGTDDYIPLISRSSLNSVNFKFQKGLKYSFYVTAIDSAENVEVKTNVPDVILNTQSFTVIISKKWNDVLVCNNIEKLFSSYQWYKNDVAITGETKQYYQEIGGLNGSYYVKVITTDGNTGVSNNINVTTSAKSIKAYPNPAADNQSFRLEIKATEEDLKEAQLTIVSLSGQVVLQDSNLQPQMLLNGLSKGCYIIHVLLTNGEQLNEKLMIN